MARRDKIHDAVKNALIKDGWQVTADPYHIKYKDIELLADLAADRPIAASKAGRLIVVEIKSFIGKSRFHDLYEALGQYRVYAEMIAAIEPERKLYLAVSDLIYFDFFQLEAIQDILNQIQLSMLVVNTQTEEIVLWIN
jgi:hypothetical protein